MLLLRIICLLSGTLAASAAQIINYGDVTAAYGGEAHYRCTMAQAAGVLQVTWQRLFRDESIKNLATYSDRFGREINEPYRDKVSFTEASLNASSITVRNLTWEDESCYVCSFNVFPDGSTSKQTCLKVQGISRVHTTYVTRGGDGSEDSEDSEVVFSCSATGKPAPTVRWDFKAGATRVGEAPTTTTTVANGDHTLTSSSNITLRIPPGWDGHADCLLNSGTVGQRLERIHFTERFTHNGTRLSSSVAAPVVIVSLFIVSIVAAAVAMRHRRLKKNGRQEDVTHDFQQMLKPPVTVDLHE